MANGYWRISQENTIYNGDENVYSILPPSVFIVGELFGDPIKDIIKKPILLDFPSVNIVGNDEAKSYGFYPQYVSLYPVYIPGSEIVARYNGIINIVVNGSSYSVEVSLNPQAITPEISFTFTVTPPEN